jgi:hypothetical protein
VVFLVRGCEICRQLSADIPCLLLIGISALIIGTAIKHYFIGVVHLSQSSSSIGR